MRVPKSRTQLFSLGDFTGGLNLTSDTFRLADNESPDMMNVDVDRRGGFQIRSGVEPYSSTALAGHPETLWAFHTSTTDYVMAQVGASIYRSTGTTWTAVGSSLGSTSVTVSPATYNNVTYWARGDAAPCKWDGTTATTLASAFNDTTTATSGNVPKANFIAAHAGYLWVANTYEGGTPYANRVRYSWANSFANSGENWRTADFIDLDTGKDGDAITAIVPFRDHLVVFKRNSVYAIYGYQSESFQAVTISNTVGAISADCVVDTPAGLFFFDRNNGLNVWDGRSVSWAFSQIWPAMRDGSIPQSQLGNIRMGWVRNRLWLSVPWETEPTIPRLYTFVYDPSAGKGGSWTRYDLRCGPYMRNQGLDLYLAALWGTTRVYQLDVPELWYDNFGTSTATIDAYLRTRWVDLNQPAIKKRWRRMEGVLQVLTPYELPVTTYSDYDPSLSRKNFKFTPRGIANPSTGSKWGQATWRGVASGVEVGDMKWSSDQTQFGDVNRGSNLGVARSVSVKVGGKVLSNASLGPQVPVFWGVDSLIFKFVPRRVR